MKNQILLTFCAGATLIGFPQVTEIAHVTVAGSLSVVAGGYLNTVTKLTITGYIDARDFVTIRDKMPLLTVLDLSKVNIAAYAGAGGTKGGLYAIYKENEIPENNFSDTSPAVNKISLSSVILPDSIRLV